MGCLINCSLRISTYNKDLRWSISEARYWTKQCKECSEDLRLKIINDSLNIINQLLRRILLTNLPYLSASALVDWYLATPTVIQSYCGIESKWRRHQCLSLILRFLLKLLVDKLISFFLLFLFVFFRLNLWTLWLIILSYFLRRHFFQLFFH